MKVWHFFYVALTGYTWFQNNVKSYYPLPKLINSLNDTSHSQYYKKLMIKNYKYEVMDMILST